MTTSDAVERLRVLAHGDVPAALADLERGRQRPYYDADGDRAAAEAYYRDVPLEHLGDFVIRTHTTAPSYRPARELYPWVDLQMDGKIRSLYTGHEWNPEDLIRADARVAEARARELAARLAQPGVRDVVEVEAEVEAALPFNCEQVVPQSWFGKQEPMRGDLHHLFACESRCNSFRGNTAYAEFPDLPEQPSPGPAIEVVSSDCGKSEGNGFEPAHGRGPSARAVFYFLLRYPGIVSPQEMPPARLEMVLGWHEGEPVSLWELHRNAAIFERQGNRNPFVDRPELAAQMLPNLSRRLAADTDPSLPG